MFSAALPTDNLYKLFALVFSIYLSASNFYFFNEEIKNKSDRLNLTLEIRDSFSEIHDYFDKDLERELIQAMILEVIELEVEKKYTGYSSKGKQVTKIHNGRIENLKELIEELRRHPVSEEWQEIFDGMDIFCKEKIEGIINNSKEKGDFSNVDELFKRLNKASARISRIWESILYQNATYETINNEFKVKKDLYENATIEELQKRNSEYESLSIIKDKYINFPEGNTKENSSAQNKSRSITQLNAKVYHLILKEKSLEKFLQYRNISNTVSGVFTILAFLLWYLKVQRHLDKRLKKLGHTTES